MTERRALITGAGGEMGSLLVPELRKRGVTVAALDLVEPPAVLREQCVETRVTSVLDTTALEEMFRRHGFTEVYHLAAVLSSKAERDPDLAHRVNVVGTYGLLRLCQQVPAHPVRFLFPSSIAVYGLPDGETKRSAGCIRADEWTTPSGMYGCNKLYCEMLGSYLTRRAPLDGEQALDFRSIRFPGLVSADTLPSGGTTDYAPEMIHAAARGERYSCFVAEGTRLPFMTMPDAVEALITLAAAAPERLSTRVYNIRGFSVSAGEIAEEVWHHFPDADIRFAPVASRQAIVDTWPEDVDDSPARRDWGLAPRHGFHAAIADYLVPALRRRSSPAAEGSGGS